jgi:flagellar protein FlbD
MGLKRSGAAADINVGECRVIELTRFNGEKFVLNADLIETVEGTPDTVIRLVTGKKMVVQETVEEVINRVLAYAQRIHQIAVPPVEEEVEES